MKDLLESLEREIKSRKITENIISQIIKANKDFTSRRIIGGYCSVDMVDREGQRIPIYALKTAVTNFMENIYYRPANVFHSDITIGRILPKWTDPRNGETYSTHVDDVGWWCLIEIRDDIEIANKVWNEVLRGNIRSFSIAGSSKEKLQKQENGVRYEEVKSLEAYEVTLCEMGINQMSKFDVLWNPTQVEI
jgi:hypothetical protein